MAEAEQEVAAQPDPVAEPARSRRVPVWVVVGVVALVVAYLLVLLLYAGSGRTEAYQPSGDPPADGVTLLIGLGDMDAHASRLHADVTIIPGSGLVAQDEMSPDRDIDIVLVPAAGAQQLRFPSGQVPATVPVELLLEGQIENWPFDRYTGPMVVQAFHGEGTARTSLPLQVDVEGRVKGWRTVVEPVTSADIALTEGLQLFQLSEARSGGTLAFGAIMLLVLVMLPVLALFVCYQVVRGRRPADVAFPGWIAAMLFATVPLRGFLPGSPPPGSWVDMTVVLWVIVGLVLALLMAVAAWWRHTAPSTGVTPSD